MSSGTFAVVRRWFRVVWRGSGGALALIVTLSAGSAVLLTAFPWIWRLLIDEVQADASPVRLRTLAGWMAAVGVAQFVLYNILQGARSILNAKIQWRARRRVFEHLTHLEGDFYRRWRAGDLVTRLTDDAGEKISWFLCSGIFRTFEAVLIVLVCLAAMAHLDPALTVWVVLPLPLLIVGQALAQGALGRRYEAVQRSISAINDELATTFEGIRIVQACGLQDAARARFSAKAAEQRDAEVRSAMVWQAVTLMYGYGWQLAVVALLIAGGMHVIDGSITLGAFVSFEGFVMTLIWPMFDVGAFVSKIQQAAVALLRLEELMEAGPDAPSDPAPLPSDLSIRVQGAAVDAEDGTRLLTDLDLELRPGELVAVVGEVGSGKTLLMSLLAGARRAAEGTVDVGGVPRDAVDMGALRRSTGYARQDPVILSTTLRDNILLGRDLSGRALERAVAVSRLAQDLPALPDGLDTTVGERGVTLSGGQKQRVGLARALVGSPRLLLLDDATAALDADTEAAFWDALEAVRADAITVVVTHRPATLRRADRVLVLEGGRIVQRGTPAALADAGGTYGRVYARYLAG